MSVLLLNANLEPLTVLPVARAVSLMLRESVDAATDEFKPIRTPNTVFELPTVLRLKRYINVPQRGISWSRHSVLIRDKYTCIFCGIKAGEMQGDLVLRPKDMTLEHILPKSRGGKDTWTNTACACSVCNNRKGSRTCSEAGMPLLWEPKTPRVDYLIVRGDVPTSWKFYFET